VSICTGLSLQILSLILTIFTCICAKFFTRVVLLLIR
jgi:hypothetical protein